MARYGVRFPATTRSETRNGLGCPFNKHFPISCSLTKLALDNAKLSAHRFCRHPFWSLLVLFLAVIPKPAFAADAVAYPPELQRALQSALEEKRPNYEPRTEHLLKNGRPRFTNRLILEDSPYLLQHAHNPVDWFPWGKEAFRKAKRENKPVFLSISGIG